MKRALKKNNLLIWHYKNGERVSGCHDRLSGDVTGISGDVSDCDLTAMDRETGVKVEDLIA